MRTKRGQAMIELAIGSLTLAIVVTTLCGFALYMVRSLKAQNSVRTGAADGNGPVEVQVFLGKDTIEKMQVKEQVRMPDLTVMP